MPILQRSAETVTLFFVFEVDNRLQENEIKKKHTKNPTKESKATDKSNQQKNKLVLYVRMELVSSLSTARWEV